ncbi:hypothetical protein GCM10022223_06200 [Kineosporia mesophila]|uniref:IclR-ED domain-containing protein n=1 Tax=Kineosporia mesophila TaxID=566012 RepID=A0ABP6Z3R4_9ACTN|nr:helix-turn-helix domain-containing protein [Kineosporia mesophila]MCD5351003.1 helix-turn-helix domain-containing protein [Kineosporia mesophila]
MTTYVTAALTIVQIIAGRRDPMLPITVGAVARELGAPLSRTSRLCSELEAVGLLEHGGAYGSYRLGLGAIQLSGRSAAPFAKSLRYALTLAGHQTGETVCLGARSGMSVRIVAAVESLWTLHAPAEVGEVVDQPEGAMLSAVRARPDGGIFESKIGSCIEIATAVLDPDGECVGVLAVRLPVYRLEQNGPRARLAVQTARLSIEQAIADRFTEPRSRPAGSPADATAPSALTAALRILHHLASQSDTIAGTARGAGLRTDRTQRLLESCRRAGLVATDGNRSRFRLSWVVQGWYRAATVPTIVERGRPLVAEVAAETGTCAFITVLKGMRSFTLVEELGMPGEGLRMSPWLGRAHPIIGSDGGPALVMDLGMREIAELFPPRYTRLELDRFLRRVRQVARDGVLTMEPFDDTGMLSISAPVRDSSGAVTAAACLVGTTDYMGVNGERFEAVAKELAGRVSDLLGHCPRIAVGER